MKSYLRFLNRNKLYTAIMAVGLCVSLAFVIIFTCYTRQQFAVCTHYPESKNIYLVGIGGQTYSYDALAEEIENEIPGVEEAVLVQNYYNSIEYKGERSSKQGKLVLDQVLIRCWMTLKRHIVLLCKAPFQIFASRLSRRLTSLAIPLLVQNQRQI